MNVGMWGKCMERSVGCSLPSVDNSVVARSVQLVRILASSCMELSHQRPIKSTARTTSLLSDRRMFPGAVKPLILSEVRVETNKVINTPRKGRSANNYVDMVYCTTHSRESMTQRADEAPPMLAPQQYSGQSQCTKCHSSR